MSRELITRQLLEELGLRNIIRIGDDYMASCPFEHLHRDGRDYHPSWGINIYNGLWNCFACGEKGNFLQLLHRLGCKDRDKIKIAQMLGCRITENQDIHTLNNSDIANSSNNEVKRKIFRIRHSDREKILTYNSSEISETSVISDEFSAIRDLYERCSVLSEDHRRYLNSRGISNIWISYWGIKSGVDILADRVVFPIYDYQGRLYALQGRIVNNDNHSRRVKYKTIGGARYVVWGEKYLPDSIKVLYIVEGIFDAAKLWVNGVPAVATLGATVSNEQMRKLYFLINRAEKVYIGFDNDNAGHQNAYKLYNKLAIYAPDKVILERWHRKALEKMQSR